MLRTSASFYGKFPAGFSSCSSTENKNPVVFAQEESLPITSSRLPSKVQEAVLEEISQLKKMLYHCSVHEGPIELKLMQDVQKRLSRLMYTPLPYSMKNQIYCWYGLIKFIALNKSIQPLTHLMENITKCENAESYIRYQDFLPEVKELLEKMDTLLLKLIRITRSAPSSTMQFSVSQYNCLSKIKNDYGMITPEMRFRFFKLCLVEDLRSLHLQAKNVLKNTVGIIETNDGKLRMESPRS